ncbi:PAS domain S-box protein [Haloparvum sp. PAK95]|uniref:PAS domain S-box protein n=1 Tax=Haloparvum sp. PAK95 TaxID=3418962 RepID=UPI003D2F347F
MSERLSSIDSALWSAAAADEDARGRALAAAVGDGLFRLDADAVFDGVGAGLTETTGYSQETLVDAHVSTILAEPTDVERLVRAIRSRRAADAAAGETVAVTLRAADGDRIPARVRLETAEEDGTFQGTVGTVRTTPGADSSTTNDRRDEPPDDSPAGSSEDPPAGSPGDPPAGSSEDAGATSTSSSVDSVLEQSDVSVFVLDDEFDVVRINDRTEEYFGLDRDAVVGRDKMAVIDETISDVVDDPETFTERVASTYEPGAPPERFECRILETDRTESRWLEHRSRPIESGAYEGGRIELYFDVTEHKRIEEDLEAKLSSILGRISDAFFALDEEYRFTHVNERAEELLQRSEGELLGESLWELYPAAAEQAEIWDSFHEAMETQEPQSYELYFQPLDFWIEAAVYPSETGVSVYFRDVTERVEQERRLRQSEERYRTLVDNFPNGAVGLFDEDLRYTIGGGELIDSFDELSDDMVGKTVHERYPDHLADLLEPKFRAALRGEERNFDLEFAGHHLDLTTLPVEDDEGDIFAGMLVVRDVTDQVQREQQLESREQALTRAYEVIADPDMAFEDQLDELLEIVRDVVGTDYGTLSHVHDDGEYVFEAVAAPPDAEIEAGDSVQLGDTNCERVVATEETLALRNVQEEAPEMADRAGNADWGISCYLGAPAIVDGDVYGTFCFYDMEARDEAFSDWEVTFVELLSNWVSYELERKHYIDRLERYETLIEESTDVNAILDPDGTIDYVTPSVEYVLGYDPDTLIGENVADYLHPDDFEGMQDEIAAIADESTSREAVEFRIQHADGSWVWLESRGKNLLEDPVIDGLVVYTRDVTDRKRYAKRLRSIVERLEESERRYRTLAENFPEGGVGIFDEDHRFSLVEGMMWDDLEIDSDDLEGAVLADALPADTAADLEPLFDRALDGETDDVTTTLEGRTYRVWATPLRDATGEVTTGQAFALDVTERLERKRELEESNERLEQFAYAASHDLQEPLRMVSSYLSLIDERYRDDLDEEAEEFIEYAIDGAERMREMIEALLEYSRVETRGDPFEPVDLERVVEDVCTDLQMQIEEANATVSVGSLPTVEGDESQLREVFMNLLGNAIEYGGEDPPSIEVESERDGDEWIIAVEDDGIGIDPEHTDRVFEVFQRLHTQDEHAGTGVGLAISQRIIERHGGEIWVDSEPGEGSTFYFSLPVTKETHD